MKLIALLSSLKVPEYDRDVVLDIYSRSTRIVPTARSTTRGTRTEIPLRGHTFLGAVETASILLCIMLSWNRSKVLPLHEILFQCYWHPSEQCGR
jgi:hypothetical protein